MSLQTNVLSTVFSLLLAVNIVGNTLVILVILKNRNMKTVMGCLLLNLAVADMMVGVFFAPGVLLMPMSAHPTGAAGDVLCKVITGKNVAWMACLGSAFTLMLVSFERFFVIVYPLNFRKKIAKRSLLFIVPALWLLAIALTLPSFFADRLVEETHLCSEKLPHLWQNVLYATVWMTFAGIIPVGVMFVFYSIVIYSFWIKKSSTGDAARLEERRSRKRVTRIVITVSVIYTLCCLPTHILYYVYVFDPDIFPRGGLFFKLSYILVVLNSSVNPFVYIFQSADFRKCLRKLMCCKGLENDQPFTHEDHQNLELLSREEKPHV